MKNIEKLLFSIFESKTKNKIFNKKTVIAYLIHRSASISLFYLLIKLLSSWTMQDRRFKRKIKMNYSSKKKDFYFEIGGFQNVSCVMNLRIFIKKKGNKWLISIKSHDQILLIKDMNIQYTIKHLNSIITQSIKHDNQSSKNPGLLDKTPTQIVQGDWNVDRWCIIQFSRVSFSNSTV
jgi:hypothetical protein